MERKNFVSMRFNDEEKEKIKAKAKSYGIPLASYCKYLILNSINKNGGDSKE
jgi:predicted DNA binding CopG/RHH family protein